MTEAQTIWDRPRAPATAYVEETSQFDGMMFKVIRRKLTFYEESAITGKAVDERTKRLDHLELLAQTVNLAVKDSLMGVPDADGSVKEWRPMGLTPQRCRALDADPDLAWFLIKWLCADTMRNLSPGNEEDLRKKSGP